MKRRVNNHSRGKSNEKISWMTRKMVIAYALLSHRAVISGSGKWLVRSHEDYIEREK